MASSVSVMVRASKMSLSISLREGVITGSGASGRRRRDLKQLKKKKGLLHLLAIKYRLNVLHNWKGE